MSTLRDLASESIGKITRRSLEPQIEQVDRVIGPAERALAIAPGRDDGVGVLVVVTDRRVLVSRGAPFSKPDLVDLPRADLRQTCAAADGREWRLDLDLGDSQMSIRGMFDRDAQRLAALLAVSPRP